MLNQSARTDGIAIKSSLCLAHFQVITELAANDTELQHVAPSIEDQNARLRVYIKNIGADREGKHKGSLEYRLRDSSNIRLRVLKFLVNLLELLEDAKCLFDESEQGRLTEMKDILKHISKTITCLMRLTIVIQSSAPHRRFFLSHDTNMYEANDIKHVEETYRLSSQQLKDRMGKANTYRRQYFNYREAHHYRIAHGSDLDGEGQSTVASSLPKGLDSESLGLEELNPSYGDLAWEFSSQSTTYDANQFDFPPIPAMSEHGPFLCPFCYMIIEADSQKAWEKHLINDIRPYLCLDVECPVTEHYQTRREWIQHMQQKHWKTWVCPKGCHQAFSSTKDFRSHMMTLHSETWESRGWDPNFENACSRPLTGWNEENCPFCVNAIITSAFEYKKHVGDHQLGLAKFVLPRRDYPTVYDETTQDEPTADEPTADELITDEPSANTSSQDLQITRAQEANTSKYSSGDPTAEPPSDQLLAAHDIQGTSVERGQGYEAVQHAQIESSTSKPANLRWVCPNCNSSNLSYDFDKSCPFCFQPQPPGVSVYEGR
ncbi:hypothetical protein PG990_009999 [Apiospora arundinis]